MHKCDAIGKDKHNLKKGRFLILKDIKRKKEGYDVGNRNPATNAAPIPGINTPEVIVPDINPPVPNRAWTAMKNGKDIDELTDEEKRMLYYGRDGLI